MATIGAVPGYLPGHVFPSRKALAAARLHRPLQAGIAGSDEGVAESIVLSGGYEDDEDYGALIVYTGQGGRDPRTGRQVADPLVDGPVDPQRPVDVLLVWPDRIEIRRVATLATLSPRPADATYRFLVPPERQAAVMDAVRRYPSPNDEAAWKLHVRTLGPDRQRIQLDLWGDGIRGAVYEATGTEIRPLHTRYTGPGFAITVAQIQFGLWAGLWLLVYLAFRMWRWRVRRRRLPDDR